MLDFEFLEDLVYLGLLSQLSSLVSLPDPYLSVYIPGLIPRPLPEYIHTLSHSQTPT